MDGNKDEADRCIKLAEKYIAAKNREKAEKFLEKAERLYPTERAKELFVQVKLIAESAGSDASELRNRKTMNDKEDVRSKPEPQYTSEQMEAVKRINKCKNFYEILGVTKDATDSDIKKAYKKLALQFHPDKNKCPGAAEAFKAIGNAVAVLTDVERRKHYDTYGPDEANLQSSRGGRNYAYTGRDFDSDEIFNMFFGGMNANNVYFRRGNRWQRANTSSRESHHHTAQHTEQSSYSAFVQLLPILLAVVLSMMSSFFVSDPPFSLQPTTKYSVKRTTQNLHVEYYVKGSFHNEYQGSVRRLEASVEEEYVAFLKQACYRERNYRETMIWRARNYGDNHMYMTAKQIKVASCDRLEELRASRVY